MKDKAMANLLFFFLKIVRIGFKNDIESEDIYFWKKTMTQKIIAALNIVLQECI